jgi:hypothetical protein
MACEVVWAELAAGAPSREKVLSDLRTIGVDYSPMDEDASLRAGEAFGRYRRRGGQRTRVLADFLVGAHALHQAQRLLTRDRGFYRTYFGGLVVIDPTT